MQAEDEACLRAEVVGIAQTMDQAGFAPSKSGNVSCRFRNGALITPSGLPYARMQPTDIVEIDAEGRPQNSNAKPSSEWRLHVTIYRERADVQAIVHTHSPRATALSCARRAIPAFHYMIAFTGGPEIRCADYATFGTQELADNAVRGLDQRKAVLLANHGVVAVGATLEGAYAIAAEVENLAAQYLALLAAGIRPVILPNDEIARVAKKFSDYGKTG
jgi:L-fuculose-phosphate aldolase